MTDAQILAILNELAQQSTEWWGTLEPGMRLVEDLGLDSLDGAQLSLDVEERFEIEFDEDDDEVIETVADLVGVIRRKLGDA